MFIARQRYSVLVALVAAGALVAVVAVSRSGDMKPSGASPGTSKAAPVPSSDGWVTSNPRILADAPRRIEHGAQLIYEAAFSVRLEGSGASAEPGLRLWGTSLLTLTATDVTGEGYTLVGQLREPSLTSENPSAFHEKLSAMVLDNLGRPFRLSVGARGRVLWLETDPDVSGLSTGLLRTIVGGLQFVTAEDSKSDEWTAQESDSYGNYRAGYRRVGVDRYTKRKLDYSKLVNTIPASAPPKFEYSAEIEHDGHFLKATRSKERMVLTFGTESMIGHNELTLQLVSLGRGEAPRLLSKLRRSSLDAPLAPSMSSEEQARERRRKSLEGKSFESLSEELANATHAEMRVEVMNQLTALLELDPSALRKTVLALKDRSKEDEHDILLGALASAESAEAKKAVVDLAADESAELGLRKQAASQLGLIEEPTSELVEGLERLSDESDPDLAKVATLSLGGAARRAEAANDEGAKQSAQAAIGRLVREAQGATSDEQRSFYLDALGNSGSPQAFNYIKRALRDPNEAVRLRAVAALRSIEGPEADALLLEALRDPSDSLRAMAVGSIASREMNEVLVAGLFVALQKEAETLVRREIVRALSTALPREDAIAALLWAVENERDKEILHAVNQSLATVGKG